MKQILQSLKTGASALSDVPVPGVTPGHLLIRSSRTLVSAGTERMLVEFGKAGWIDKARQQPDKVRMVLDKIRTDGLQPTVEAIFNKLDQLIGCIRSGATRFGVVVQNWVDNGARGALFCVNHIRDRPSTRIENSMDVWG